MPVENLVSSCTCPSPCAYHRPLPVQQWIYPTAPQPGLASTSASSQIAHPNSAHPLTQPAYQHLHSFIQTPLYYYHVPYTNNGDPRLQTVHPSFIPYYHPNHPIPPADPRVSVQSVNTELTLSATAQPTGRKRRTNNAPKPPPRKRARAPPPVDTGPVSTQVGIGSPPLPSPTIPSPTTNEPQAEINAAPESTTTASMHLPTASYPSLHRHRSRQPVAAATDVYYFCRALDTQENVKPASFSDDPVLATKPKSEWLGCKLCTKTYKNGDGRTSTIRKHLKSDHAEEYRRVVNALKLKHADNGTDTRLQLGTPACGLFQVDEWIRLLVRWVVADDQAINVVESKEFRDFVLYGRDDTSHRSLPHRTKLIEIIFETYEKEHIKLKSEFKTALGRISFTSDCWSDPNPISFLSLTAHFLTHNLNGRLVQKNKLLAFRVIEGGHTGVNLAIIIFNVLKEAEILNKLGQFTFHNASDCDTIMEALKGLLKTQNIQFYQHDVRIQCFPHVVNVATQNILSELKENSYWPVLNPPVTDNSPPAIFLSAVQLEEYARTLQMDPVGRAHSIVAVCGKSAQRREELHSIIVQGNEQLAWVVRPAQLLRDSETCWSSTFNMMDRLIELYAPIQHFLSQPALAEHAHLLFKEKEYEILHRIHQILEVPQRCQELLSAEKNPTLSRAIPIYESLMMLWKCLAKVIPELSHYINIGISKIMEYVANGRHSRIYALAMIINPAMKMKWIEEHWSSEDSVMAEAWMEEAMLAYCRAHRRANPKANMAPRGLSHHGALSAQLQWPQRFMQFNTVHCTATLPSISEMPPLSKAVSLNRSPSHSPNVLTPIMPTITGLHSSSKTSDSESEPSTLETPEVDKLGQVADSEKSRIEAEELEKDKCTVKNELYRYKADGSLPDDGLPLDLLAYWDASERSYPLIHKVALDILPVQASSVSCERIVSSSKETCTLRWSLDSSSLLEVLQVLKHVYKQERLDFSSHWVAKEEDYSIEKATELGIQELAAQGKTEELLDILRNTDITDSQT